jgi:hypothetical protein
MATSGTVRVSGPVLSVIDRSGVSKKGVAYAFRQLMVLVGGVGVLEVSVDPDAAFLGGNLPDAGEYVDFVATVRSNQYGLSVNAVGIFQTTQLAAK